MDKLFQKFSRAFMVLLMFNVVAAILMQLIGRIISKPFSWTLEFACYNFVWLVFFGAVVIMRDGKHIQISYFVDRMPKNVRAALFYFRHALALACMLFLLRTSFVYAMNSAKIRSAALHLPMICVDISVFVSFTLLIIETIRQMIKGYHED